MLCYSNGSDKKKVNSVGVVGKLNVEKGEWVEIEGIWERDMG